MPYLSLPAAPFPAAPSLSPSALDGLMVLELGQPAQPNAALVAAQTATEAAAATGNNAPAPSSTTALLGWGCAYALLMFINLKLSLRWLRLRR